MKAIGDEIEIIEEKPGKAMDRKILKLMKPIIDQYGKARFDEAINEGVMQILRNPKYAGILKSLVKSAVVRPAVKYVVKL